MQRAFYSKSQAFSWRARRRERPKMSMIATSGQFTGFCQVVVRSRSLSIFFSALSVTPLACHASRRSSCGQLLADSWILMSVYDDVA